MKGFVKEAKDGGVGVFGWANWRVRRTRSREASEMERWKDRAEGRGGSKIWEL